MILVLTMDLENLILLPKTLGPDLCRNQSNQNQKRAMKKNLRLPSRKTLLQVLINSTKHLTILLTKHLILLIHLLHLTIRVVKKHRTSLTLITINNHQVKIKKQRISSVMKQSKIKHQISNQRKKMFKKLHLTYSMPVLPILSK